MKNIFIVFMIVLSGCTTLGEPFREAPKPDSGKSLVYVFRESISFGNVWMTNFLINDETFVSLYDKGYSWIHIPPGKHTFKIHNDMSSPSDDLSISGYIQPDSVYYIGYSEEKTGNNSVRLILKAYEKKQGHTIISQYAYKAAKPIEAYK